MELVKKYNYKNGEHIYTIYNLRKFSFTNRIVDLWNTLPQSVIDAKDVRQFEIWLDKYWEHPQGLGASEKK